MKKIVLIALLAICFGANAQQMFDFSLNTPRLEGGLNFGEAGFSTPYARLALGANILFNGFYFDYLKANPEHRYTDTHEVSDAIWNDHVAVCINAGYQIPVFSWLRVLPLLGYAQTNDGVTDGSKINVEENDSSFDFYHPYKVTPGTRTHYFNFGGGLSIQPCKWFSINLIATRTALYGGFSINALAFK